MSATIPRSLRERLDKIKQLQLTAPNDLKRRGDLVRLFKNKKRKSYLPFQLMRDELAYFEGLDDWHQKYLAQIEEPDVCLRCEEEEQHGYCNHVVEGGE